MMKRTILTLALISTVAFGCSDEDTMGTGGVGGGGGMGGMDTIGPLTWTTPGVTFNPADDECDFFADEAAVYDMTIEGSTLTLEQNFEGLGGFGGSGPPVFILTTDNYSPEQDVVRVTGTATNDNFPPCVVRLDDAFRMELDDPDLSIDLNDTVQVTWDHSEEDVSENVGDCAGEWFVDLPCAGTATFTLTQEP